jgi:ketosteroid isomerase-like protein
MTETDRVTHTVCEFLAAVESGDRGAILASHAEDLRMFDFPDTVEGLDEHRAQWEFFYDNQMGPITFAPEGLRTVAGDTAAFVSCLVHCAGTEGGDFRFRLTVGLEKREGRWMIVHEHHSLPAQDEAMVMPEKRAGLGLT